jgi:hypothetical protein
MSRGGSIGLKQPGLLPVPSIFHLALLEYAAKWLCCEYSEGEKGEQINRTPAFLRRPASHHR